MMLRSAIMLAAVAAATATAPGIRASVSSAGLQYIVGVAIPMIEKKFSTINIPDYSTKTHDVTVDLSSATCHLESLGSGSLSSDPGQGVAGQITGISVSCSAHVHARLDIWPHPSCSFDLDGSVGGGSASLVLDITDNGGHPELVAKSIDVNVGDFDIHFHGGICSIVADLIKDIADTFFKKTVDHLVEKEIDSVLGTFISNDANKIINSIPLDIPLPFKAPYDISDIDFTLSDSPAFETGYIGIDVVGAVVNAQTKAPAPFPAPTIPAFSSSSAAHYIQLFLSPYVLESAVWTFQQAGLVKFNVKHTLIPASFPVQLNTTDLALIAPGIKTAFPNDWVDIEVTMPLSDKATITASPAGVAASVPLQLEFNAVTASGDKNAFVLGCDFDGDILLTAETNSTTGFPMIAGNLSYLKCPLSVVSSNVGTVSPGLAAALVDLILGDIITPLVNVLLKVGIPLPTVDGLTFTQLELINGNGYVQLATDFTYTPTAAQEEPALLGAPMPFAPLADAKPALRGMA